MFDLQEIISKSFKSNNFRHKATINEVVFEFEPPSNKDEVILADVLSHAGEDIVGSFSEFRSRTIASMLISVNGQVIPEEVDHNGVMMDRVKYLVLVIDTWPASLVTVLDMVCRDLKHKYRSEIRSSTKYEWFGADLLEADEEAEKREAAILQEVEEEQGRRSLREVQERDIPESSGSFEKPSEIE